MLREGQHRGQYAGTFPATRGTPDPRSHTAFAPTARAVYPQRGLKLPANSRFLRPYARTGARTLCARSGSNDQETGAYRPVEPPARVRLARGFVVRLLTVELHPSARKH